MKDSTEGCMTNEITDDLAGSLRESLRLMDWALGPTDSKIEARQVIAMKRRAKSALADYDKAPRDESAWRVTR